MTIRIRPARTTDGEALRQIERLAGERFRAVGLGAIADDEPPSIEVLDAYAVAGRSWVAVDGTGAPVGYLLADVVDNCAHVEQVSVDPDHQGAGVGRALMEQVEAWARSSAMPAITLTTFSDVPWNRPLYEHLGFRVLVDGQLGPELTAVRDAEAAHCLDPALRVYMRLDLGPADQSAGQTAGMEQRVSVITLGVRDLARARAFYEAIGWTAGGGTDDVVFFQAGGMVVGLWDREKLAEDSAAEDTGGWGGITLAYNARSPEEVDAVVAAAAAAGGTVGRPPGATFWGGYAGVFIDTEGHPWEVAHNPHWDLAADGSVSIRG